MELLTGYPAAPSGGARLAATNDRLDHLNFGTVDLAGRLVAKKLVNVSFKLGCAIRGNIKVPVEFGDEVCKANCVIVKYGNIARSLVGNMDLVSLLYQADQGAAHGDHIVIRMRRENQDPLGEDMVIALWSISGLFAIIWFTPRPSGNRCL